jgi:iron complex outermembrane receptor protein
MSLMRAAALVLVGSLALDLCAGAGEVAGVTSDEPPEQATAAALEEHVRVTARASAVEDVAAFSTSLDLEAVTRRGEDLADLLRRVPGSRVRDYGGLGSYATVSLRGATAEQVTVLVDGVPQNRALGGPVDLSSVPTTQVEQVTVFRGFAPATAGRGGIGGLIDVRTREPGPAPELAVDLVAGELDTQRLSGGASFAALGGHLRLGLEAVRSDGDFLYYDGHGTPLNSADDRITRRINNDVRQAAVVVRQRWEQVAGGRLGLGLRVEDRDRGLPGIENWQSSTARMEEGLADLSGSWQRGLEGWLDGLELSFDAFGQRTDYLPGDEPIGAATDRTTRLSGGGLAALARSSIGSNALLFRAELRNEVARVRTVPASVAAEGDAGRRALALVAEDVAVAGRFTLAPSLRWETLSSDAFGSEPGLDDAAWSGKIGAAFHVREGLDVRGSAGRYQRNPSLSELYGDSGEVAGNPALAPERGDAAELGLALRHRPRELGLRLEIVGFGRRVEDLIWLTPVTPGASTYRNVAKAEIRGLELTAGLDVGEHWGLDVAGTWQHSEDTSDGFTAGNPLVYQPELAGWGALTWGGEGFRAGWEIAYVGENSTTQLDWPEYRVPERVLHDLHASWNVAGGMRAGIDVRNVFDRQVLDVRRYPLPDRTVYLHLGWRSETTP